MKFIFDRDAMIKEISIAQEIISTKNVTSILSNVLFIAEINTLTIKATDIKVTFETKLPVEVFEPGTTTILCDKFMSILNSLPSGEIEFNQNDIKVIINPIATKATFQLKSMASDQFPEFNTIDEIKYFEIPASEIKEMITQTIFAISDDETRYFMNGVYFEKKDDNLILVATDGRRLAYIEKNICQGVENFKSAIVPPKILNIILKRIPSEGNIQLSITEKNIYFKIGNYKFSSILIDGQFPNYTRVIPEKQTFSFEVEKKDLIDALKRVSLLVEKSSQRIYFNITSGNLIITSQENEIGTAKAEIPCMYDGMEITIAFNYLHFEEPMKVITADRLKIEFTESMRAVTMKVIPNADYFHIIMPMQME